MIVRQSYAFCRDCFPHVHQYEIILTRSGRIKGGIRAGMHPLAQFMTQSPKADEPAGLSKRLIELRSRLCNSVRTDTAKTPPRSPYLRAIVAPVTHYRDICPIRVSHPQHRNFYLAPSFGVIKKNSSSMADCHEVEVHRKALRKNATGTIVPEHGCQRTWLAGVPQRFSGRVI